MKGYLLDTNIISYWLDAKRAEHVPVHGRIEQLPSSSRLYISAISWGEIEYGNRSPSPLAARPPVDTNKYCLKPIKTLPVSHHTRAYYGLLRALLFERFAPKNKKTKKLRPEQLIDPVTSLELGIQENDLWLAAQAYEHNLILVSNDGMNRITSVVGEFSEVIKTMGDLRIENWASTN